MMEAMTSTFRDVIDRGQDIGAALRQLSSDHAILAERESKEGVKQALQAISLVVAGMIAIFVSLLATSLTIFFLLVPEYLSSVQAAATIAAFWFFLGIIAAWYGFYRSKSISFLPHDSIN